ncbi:MAG: toprim domain-containing protein [Nitrosomonas sp.]|jgi:hypothetical protein|uniref:Uncharacterized domain associated with phage/plasmid primase n=1 Tax=Nitrosomonas aestuarii TaxID=52441 RepID=A0A1I4FVR0_9PROT|nr:toprim domain-containing protein [Nitrosomonas aestuarii]MBX3630660.1 toprim domain-containing protein [Nitrosomonas sp.]SFL20936.1 Uncharacterized domain associated with phage/plasmid primase [Nitrosomonas aestuarii]
MNANEVKDRAYGRWIDILSNLSPQLVPAIQKTGRHVACPVHGGKDGFRVFRNVATTGGSVCNTCGVHSDGFATLMWCNGWDFVTALNAVADYCGMSESCQQSRKQRKCIQTFQSLTPIDQEDNRIRQVLNCVWHESVAITDRSAMSARLYLARRGISISPPETLRFHPALPYFEGKDKIGEFPAMLAMLTGSDGLPVTIHRTYLTADGFKAPIESPRKLMPYPPNREIVGSAIRLCVESTVLAIAEGLETALAVMEATGLSVWCAVNVRLLEAMTFPKQVEQVLIFADQDRPTQQHPNGHGREAAINLLQRLWQSGFRASIHMPEGEIKSGEKSLDWLDVLRTQGKAGFPVISGRCKRHVA